VFWVITISPHAKREYLHSPKKRGEGFHSTQCLSIREDFPGLAEIKADPAGFEPAIYGLEGRRKVVEAEKFKKPAEEEAEKKPAEEITFDFKEFYDKYKAEFEKWLEKRVEEKTMKDYLSAIDRYLVKGVKEPKDMDDVIQSKATAKGLRNFLNFLEDQYYITELGGYSLDLWRNHMPIEASYERKDTIFLTNEQVAEAYELIKEKWKDEATEILFKLVVFSGIRFEHAHRLINTFDKRKLIIEDNIAYYPIQDLTKGKKQGYFAFMPVEFAKKLRKFDKLLKSNSYENRLQPTRWKPPRDNPTCVVRLRSWFQNFAIDNGLRTEAVRFIVGHSPATVGEAHYYNMLKIAREEYKKIVDKFPIPP